MQNISPGPAIYSSISQVGGPRQSIGRELRFREPRNSKNGYPNSGPGSYNISNVDLLKKFPRATIGNSNRNLIRSLVTPGPGTYQADVPIGRTRSNSADKNAPRCIIGRSKRDNHKNLEVPGPQNYNTKAFRETGGNESIKISFTTADRPITARNGKINLKTLVPGPQDYDAVSTDKYLKRNFVIPASSFPISKRDASSRRMHSPGPEQYQPNNTSVLNRSPSFTIGTSKRPQIVNPGKSLSPGPQDYNTNVSTNQGP